MVNPLSSEAQTGGDIGLVEVRKLFENLRKAQTVGEKVQDICDSDAHAPDTGAAATLFGIDGNTLGDLGHRQHLPLTSIPDGRPASSGGFDLLRDPRDPFILALDPFLRRATAKRLPECADFAPPPAPAPHFRDRSGISTGREATEEIGAQSPTRERG